MNQTNVKNMIENRKFLFFGGKGGVGKTTMAAATATWLADQGYNTLIVATDPTVSLSATYEQKIGETEITNITKIENLCGLNINPKKATGVFQNRLQGMMQNFDQILGKDAISTPCAEEMAAFDQFVTYLGDKTYDHVVFDTAPTGHTLRELSMPFDWSTFMTNQIKNRKELSEALGGVDESTLEGLKQEKNRYDQAVKSLSDETTSAFNLVLLPEKLPIEETARAVADLSKFGINVASLVVNEVIPTNVLNGNWFLEKRRATQEKYFKEIETRFNGIPKSEVPLFETDVYGIESLRKVGKHLYGQ
ncbi:MAG: arsenical pump-driving ATPase GET3 [Candidatus Bathyarchaeota archaeon]|nr:arsenical pump-driving ATPase GET3 [Candidatus Bathyarchaeota archaeon]